MLAENNGLLRPQARRVAHSAISSHIQEPVEDPLLVDISLPTAIGIHRVDTGRSVEGRELKKKALQIFCYTDILTLSLLSASPACRRHSTWVWEWPSHFTTA